MIGTDDDWDDNISYRQYTNRQRWLLVVEVLVLLLVASGAFISLWYSPYNQWARDSDTIGLISMKQYDLSKDLGYDAAHLFVEDVCPGATLVYYQIHIWNGETHKVFSFQNPQ